MEKLCDVGYCSGFCSWVPSSSGGHDVHVCLTDHKRAIGRDFVEGHPLRLCGLGILPGGLAASSLLD